MFVLEAWLVLVYFERISFLDCECLCVVCILMLFCGKKYKLEISRRKLIFLYQFEFVLPVWGQGLVSNKGNHLEVIIAQKLLLILLMQGGSDLSWA